jgi:RimJ/RimL family protein N-acetyltransferase
MTRTDEWFAPATLTGASLTLAPMRLTDAADYLAALGNPEDAAAVVAHLTFARPDDKQTVRAIIGAALADTTRIPYVQRLTATGEMVGTTSFYEVIPAVRAIAIGHTWIGRRFWRTGVNTESKLIMLTRAFEGLGAERVVWHTDIRNVRSQAAIERLGAQKEGILRHHRIRPDGSWRDTVQYSMLRSEWPTAKQRLASAGRDVEARSQPAG